MLILLARTRETCHSAAGKLSGSGCRTQHLEEGLRLSLDYPSPPMSQSTSTLLNDRPSSLDNAHEKEHPSFTAALLLLRFKFLTPFLLKFHLHIKRYL